jgi:hypothetical protein
LITKLRDVSRPVFDFLDVMQGIVPYSKENHSPEILEGRTFHSNEPLTVDSGPWVKGRGISRYGIQFEANEYLNYGPWLHRARKPKYFNGRRLLIQEITGGKPPRICACLCEERLYHDPGITACLSKEGLGL